jgi:flagellar hook-associated protein 2
MAQITSTTGLISGINTSSLISQLISLDAAPVSLLQTRITSDQTLGAMYSSLGSQLSTLQTTAQSLEKPQTFQDTSATSSDPSILTATTTEGASVGTYSLRVARTVSTQQLVTGGFTDSTNAKVGAGTITIGEGGGSQLATQTTLAELNGGSGVTRGQFRITDRSGASAVIDTSSAVSLDDVVADINSATNISVRASVVNNHLVLTDTSGQTSSNLIVQDLGTGTTAANLGIVANTATATVTGTNINYVGRSTLLAQLNDGRGVTLGSGGATGDLKITARNGAVYNVSLSGVTTVGGAIDAINAATGGHVTASVATGSSGLTLTDSSGGGGTLSVADNNGSKAVEGLGLTTAASGNTLTGKSVLAGIDSTLLSSLNGGSGLTLGSLTITDAAGASHTVDLSSASDVQGVIDAINAGTGGAVEASLKTSGTGIQLTDETGATGSLTVAAGATATALGLAGTSTTGSIQGSDLDKQWLTSNTLLSSLNGGQGIGDGTFTITTAAGTSATITVDSTITTVAQLLYQINSKGVTGLSASVNATGNGLLITDASGGAGQLTVADNSGTAAADLNISGTAATGATTINGAYQKTITVTANDTLSTVLTKINNADAGVTASVISDGSSTAPYRLSIVSNNSGVAGAVSFDAGTTGLSAQTLVAAQDAAVFVGGAGSNSSSGSSTTTAQPLLITSSSDTVTGVIPGVTLSLLGVSSGTVQLTIAADADSLVQSLDSFTSSFNTLTETISSQSTFNTSSNTGGLLLGDPVALDIQSSLTSMLSTKVSNNGDYPTIYNIGFSVGTDDQLTFDENTFRAAFAKDPSAVQALFNSTTTVSNASSGSPSNASSGSTTVQNGIAYAFDKVLTRLADPISGSVTSATNELTTEEQGFTDQITVLNGLLAQKQAVYQQQFNDMESALASLQSISKSLSGIGTVSTSAASSSTSSTSSSSG